MYPRLSAAKKSSPLGGGLALLENGADPFVLVFSRKAQREQIYFAAQALVQIRARSKLHRFFRKLQRDRTLLRDARCDFHRLRLELVGGNNMIHQANIKSGTSV